MISKEIIVDQKIKIIKNKTILNLKLINFF